MSALLVILSGPSAEAHGSGSGFVLLLPTGYAALAGAAAVAVSFLLVALTPPALVDRLASARAQLLSLPVRDPWPVSLASFLVLVGLLLVGWTGSPDPLANLLPLTVWTIWWVGLALLQALLGDLWEWLNPWTGPYRIVQRLSGRRLANAPLTYPAWLGYWPALVAFFGFAWLELVDPAPADPRRLTLFVAAYWGFVFAGMLLFGEPAWRERAEPFSIFFRLLAGLSPLVWSPQPGAPDRTALSVAWPGASLLARPPLPFSGVLFVLLTLSAVTFDGLSRTFWWLARIGVNPLEFPGRSAVMQPNTAGLALTFAALATAYVTAVRLGWLATGLKAWLSGALGILVFSLVPISLAFHVAHYLTALLVDSQYALAAASDPFAHGRDLLGFDRRAVTTSFLNTYSGVRCIWIVQTAAIVAGHIAAVALAHALALRHFADRRSVLLAEAPLALLMVLYTLLGLWLLSTPAAL